jgi:chorismate synthase
VTPEPVTPEPVTPEFELRELHTVEEFSTLIALEERIWGVGEGMNRDLLTAMVHIGALAAGAFTDGKMVALLLGVPTREATVQHSHALGVLEEYRRYGLGAKLKWFQRDWCLTHNINRVQWTYDPLRLANAYLNLHKLGASVGTHHHNYYGEMSGINAGAPSDRLLAEWDLTATNVKARAMGTAPSSFPTSVPSTNVVESSRPVSVNLRLEESQLRFTIPNDFPTMQTKNPRLALEWREHTRSVLDHYLARGYRLTNFDAQHKQYLLERGDQTTPQTEPH